MGSTLMTTNKVTPITAAGEKRFERQAEVSAIPLPVDASLRAAEIRQDKPVEHSGHSGRTYRILSDGSAGLLSATAELPQDAVAFSSPEQLDAVTANWPMRRLIDVWNQLPGQRRVARFENRSVAVQRLWRAIESLQLLAAKPQEVEPTKKEVRRRTTAERILELLKAPEGATLAALMQATGWQAHSVRGFLSGKLSKQMGLLVSSVRRNGAKGVGPKPPATRRPGERVDRFRDLIQR